MPNIVHWFANISNILAMCSKYLRPNSPKMIFKYTKSLEILKSILNIILLFMSYYIYIFLILIPQLVNILFFVVFFILYLYIFFSYIIVIYFRKYKKIIIITQLYRNLKWWQKKLNKRKLKKNLQDSVR